MKWFRMAFERLIKCKQCKELVPDSNYCNQCGAPLK
jgi:RNA polymerase subunit RPABC4/transcription elongation factor Spt4